MGISEAQVCNSHLKKLLLLTESDFLRPRRRPWAAAAASSASTGVTMRNVRFAESLSGQSRWQCQTAAATFSATLASSPGSPNPSPTAPWTGWISCSLKFLIARANSSALKKWRPRNKRTMLNLT